MESPAHPFWFVLIAIFAAIMGITAARAHEIEESESSEILMSYALRSEKRIEK